MQYFLPVHLLFGVLFEDTVASQLETNISLVCVHFFHNSCKPVSVGGYSCYAGQAWHSYEAMPLKFQEQ